MAKLRRLKSDMATTDKRKMADKAKSDSRDRNDVLTQERRSEEDATLNKNRERNDETTANRRRIKDSNHSKWTLIIFLLVLITLAIGAFSIFT